MPCLTLRLGAYDERSEGHRYLRTELGRTVTGNMSAAWSVENQTKSNEGGGREFDGPPRLSRPSRSDIGCLAITVHLSLSRNPRLELKPQTRKVRANVKIGTRTCILTRGPVV